ncbi:MAG TPA: hypothetical protein VFJ17_13280 [Mycobacteriales bacterium]|nr:hypothetical protein [Mycobacteriales bacterium]
MQVAGPNASRDYIGPDRRRASPARREDVDVESLLWLAFALVGVGIVLPIVLGAVLSGTTSAELVVAERALVTALFLGAGLLRVARWRLTGESLDALSGTALAVFALTSYPLGSIGVLVYSDESAGMLNPISRIVAVAICVAILIRAFRAPTVDSRLRPLRMTVNIVVPVWLAYVGLSILAGAVGRLHVDGHVWAFLELLLTIAWGYAAFRALVVCARAHRPSLMWAGLGLATMAAGELVRAWAFLDLFPAALSSTGLQLVAAFVAVANAAFDLGEIFNTEGNRFLSVVATLARAERILASREQRRQEQAHDARSVIAALRAASLTLERYGDKLEANDRQTLRSGLTRELAQLEHLIEPPAPERTRDFDLQELSRPAASEPAGVGEM